MHNMSYTFAGEGGGKGGSDNKNHSLSIMEHLWVVILLISLCAPEVY